MDKNRKILSLAKIEKFDIFCFIQMFIFKMKPNTTDTKKVLIGNGEQLFVILPDDVVFVRKIPVNLLRDPAVACGLGLRDRILQAI